MYCVWIKGKLHYNWNIPEELNQNFPNLRSLVSRITLPSNDQRDTLVWNHSSKGDLTQKDAYAFKKHHFPKIKWARLIWSKDIPPSKLPTDEVLASRGCLQFVPYAWLKKNPFFIYFFYVSMQLIFGDGLPLV